MLKTRIITASILLPLVIAAIIFLPPLYFVIFTALFVLIGAWEWAALCGISQKLLRASYVILVAAGLFFLADFPVSWLLLVALPIWLWFATAIFVYQKTEKRCGFQFATLRFFTGFFVLCATWSSIVTLKIHPNLGASWLILALCIIFMADIGAYFAGRFLGDKKLCSRVSPKKTWAGFFGGIFSAVLVAAIGGLFLSLTLSQYFILLAIALLTALFSVVGDLSVSLLKRIANVKDSGAIFPGHGGMLDRLDSIAAATVIFVLGAMLFF